MATTRIFIHSIYKQCNKFNLHSSTQSFKNAVINPSFCVQHITKSLVCTTWRSSHTFLSRLNADKLWKGVTSVSNAGRRKGRGKASGRTRARDLNRGQVIGFGKKNMLWPGLNAPIVQGKETLRQQALPPDEAREKRLLELRDKMVTRKAFKIHPLERGWAGTRLPGRSLGPPESLDGSESAFEGFDSRVLQFRVVQHVTKQRGKVRVFNGFVAVGNKNGLAGFALARSVNGMTAAKSARNKAGKNLRYIERDGTSVVHDFYSEFGSVRIFVKKKPEGFGLVCHRVIRAICEVVGIKDLYAKVEGPSNNYQCLTKAFFIGLMSQKSYQQLAEEKGLHLVETRQDCDDFPRLVASPSRCRTEDEIGTHEQLDYRLHLHGGRVERPRPKWKPFYSEYPSYIKEMRDRAYMRNHKKVRMHLIAKYGDVKSFLTVREEQKAQEEAKKKVQEA